MSALLVTKTLTTLGLTRLTTGAKLVDIFTSVLSGLASRTIAGLLASLFSTACVTAKTDTMARMDPASIERGTRIDDDRLFVLGCVFICPILPRSHYRRLTPGL